MAAASRVKLVSPAFWMCRLMLFGGHVVNGTGRLVTLPTLAKIVLPPGVAAVARPFASTVATEVVVLNQLIAPTVEVTSVPLLKAVAVNC